MADVISKINVNNTTYDLKDGRIPTFPGTTNTYLRGDGTWSTPSSGIPMPASATSGDFLVYNGTAWVAQTMNVYDGGSY